MAEGFGEVVVARGGVPEMERPGKRARVTPILPRIGDAYERELQLFCHATFFFVLVDL